MLIRLNTQGSRPALDIEQARLDLGEPPEGGVHRHPANGLFFLKELGSPGWHRLDHGLRDDGCEKTVLAVAEVVLAHHEAMVGEKLDDRIALSCKGLFKRRLRSAVVDRPLGDFADGPANRGHPLAVRQLGLE